jgi:hypothetical protein
MIILVKYPSGEISNIGQNFYGDKVVGPEEDVCKAKPLFEIGMDPKYVVPSRIDNISVFGDVCSFVLKEGVMFLRVPKGEVIGNLLCHNLAQAVCSKISDGRSKDGALKCANIGLTFYDAVTCVWPGALKRFQDQNVNFDKLGFGNFTIGA